MPKKRITLVIKSDEKRTKQKFSDKHVRNLMRSWQVYVLSFFSNALFYAPFEQQVTLIVRLIDGAIISRSAASTISSVPKKLKTP